MATADERAQARMDGVWSEINLLRLSGVPEKVVAEREADLLAAVGLMNARDRGE